MKEFRDRVAVVTGGASGIGRGLAERFAAEGMKVVLADVEQAALEQTASEMKASGATVLAVRTDVSKADEVQALADRALEAFGAVHIVCNNAGVSTGGGSTWEKTLADWEWVMGVNLWGVIHGIRSFLPIMLRQQTEGHVVNTASLAGLISGSFNSIYGVTKHAVVTLSESLYHELKLNEAKVGVSVLCPAWVNTKILDANRNRPAQLQNEPNTDAAAPDGREQIVRGLLAQGLSPAVVADKVFAAIQNDQFYVLPHPEYKPLIRTRMEDILEERNPSSNPMAGAFSRQQQEG